MAPVIHESGYYHLDTRIEEFRKELNDKVELVRTELGGKIDSLSVQLIGVSANQHKSSGRRELARWAIPLLLVLVQIYISIRTGVGR